MLEKTEMGQISGLKKPHPGSEVLELLHRGGEKTFSFSHSEIIVTSLSQV